MMITEAVINLSIVGGTCLILIIYMLRFVLRYKHQYDSNPLCTLTVLFCLLLVLMAAFILPVDIFLVSFVKETNGNFKEWATNETLATIDQVVFGTYYSFYGVSTLLMFVVIPFLHFYNEETEPTSADRLSTAVRYTFCFILSMLLMFFVGAFIHDNEIDPNFIFSKILHLSQMSKFQDAMTLMLALLTAAGYLNVSFYTAAGIFSWPVGLLLGTSSVSSRVQAVSDMETLLRMRINTLQTKSRLSQLSSAEQAQLIEAERDLFNLEREESALTNYRDSWSYRIRFAVRPLQILIGLLFGVISIVLVVTLILANLDRSFHGAGPKEGYILLEPEFFNPIGYISTKLQGMVLIGPVPLLVIMSFLVVATISGIRNLGLWFMFAKIHQVKVGRTPPQALLFFCITVMLTSLAFNLLLYSMSAQYVTFGNQNFQLTGVNGTVVEPCNLKEYNNNCILTRGSVLLMRMMSQVWIFGAFFYWWGWVFVTVSSISFVAFLVRGKRRAAHGIMSDESELEE